MFGNLPPLIAAQHIGAASPGMAYRPARLHPEATVASSYRVDVRFGRCEVRIARRELWVKGRARPLQPRPFDLLVYLIEHRSRVVTIDELLDTLWGDACVQQGSLPAAIMRVRKALSCADAPADEVIRTYSRVGYRFVAPVEGDPARR